MLNTYKTLKRYCIATLNVSIKKKFCDDDNKIDKFFLCQFKILLLNMLKLFSILDFLLTFVKIPGFFFRF